METEETKQNSQQNEFTVQKDNLPIHFQVIKNIELWDDKIFDCVYINSHLIAILSLEKTVTVLNINTYKIIHKIQLPTLCFTILAIPQYKNTLLVGTRAGNILIYENLHQFKGKLQASENCQAIFGLIQYKKSCQFFCYGKSGEVIHWDLKKREKIGVFQMSQDYANRHNFGYFSKTLTIPFQNYDHDIQTKAKHKKIHKFITTSQKLEIMK